MEEPSDASYERELERLQQLQCDNASTAYEVKELLRDVEAADDREACTCSVQ